MTYEDKITRLNPEEFFSLFEDLHAEPRWVNSRGKQSIQVLGLCHHGENHSALFDPTTLKVNCFSECGGGMLLHTWVKRTLDLPDPDLAKQYIEDWIDGERHQPGKRRKPIDLSNRRPAKVDFDFKERPFELEHIEPVCGIPQDIVADLYRDFQYTPDILERLKWHTEDGISVEMLQKYQVAYYPENGSIVFPHHNINGEIVGLYERSFRMLRKEFCKLYPEIDYKQTLFFPTAKYLPLLIADKYKDRIPGKNRWSFPNSLNLYGLHIAAPYIKESGEAIIFEGAKSVMLAHQWGIKNTVASHTFGCNLNHINMLYECGARKIYFAFDKQYQEQSEYDHDWYLYDKRTKGMAEKIRDIGGMEIRRIIDLPNTGVPLDHKDAPVDKGKEKFLALYEAAKASPPLWVPEVKPAAPQLPLPLEEDTSAALEEAAAEPTFRDLPIAWENVTTEENGKQRTGHWIVWNGNRSKREEFFKLAFPDQYNKVKKRVKFLGQAGDDVLRLTGGQRTKLMYEILAWKYGLEEVDEQDSLDLIRLCQREEDNKTADDLLSRLHWPNGLSKLVTFGVGMKLDAAAQQTWCYSVDYQEDRALFTGSSMTWERWQVKLIEVLDRCRACRYSYSKMWK